MLFTKQDYYEIICENCNNEACQNRIEVTEKNGIETMACADYKLAGGIK